MIRRLLVLTAVALVAAASLWYLTAPPKGIDGYRERAASTAETLRSQVQSTRIWLESVEDGDSTHAAALIGFLEAEQDASAVASDFEAYEPPTGTFGLRSSLSALSSDVTEALGALRIAGQQEEWAALGRLARPLARLNTELARFEERAEP